MNENEIKENLNKLRHDLDKKKKEISEVISEVRIYQKEIASLRTERDKGNEGCKTLSQEAKTMRDKRDELNTKIAKLKEKRKKLNEKIKSKSEVIKANKEKRDELNRSAKGTGKTLLSRFDHDMDQLLNRDIPLEKEMKLFEQVVGLLDRVEAAKEATAFHEKVLTTYDEIKSLDSKADELSDKIRALADESEKYHLKAVEIYAVVDETRKNADEAHEKILEKYKILSPLRDRITALKKEMDDIQETMAPYLEGMDQLRAEKDLEKKKQLAEDAKEKLKTSKRISFDDFRAIMA
ncbi:MAG: hypothetical protein KKD39_07825, partial [Candidatus Altiarchaeota archaeon]|nr:hypothetical protein [Candidatus Altiarchaeota archaeon]